MEVNLANVLVANRVAAANPALAAALVLVLGNVAASLAPRKQVTKPNVPAALDARPANVLAAANVPAAAKVLANVPAAAAVLANAGSLVPCPCGKV